LNVRCITTKGAERGGYGRRHNRYCGSTAVTPFKILRIGQL